MAKKTTAVTSTPAKSRSVAPDAQAKQPVRETKTRNSAVPPAAKSKAAKSSATTTEVTDDMVAERAYHLWKAGHPGGHFEHWTTAERELRGK